MKIFLIIAITFTSTALFASYKEALDLYEKKMYNESLKIIATELDAKKDANADSENYNMRFLAAHDHWKLGNLDSAVIHFKKCMEIKKTSADPIIDLSLMLFEFKRYGDAFYFSNKALEISENPVSYYVLAKYYVVAGNLIKAKEYFEKAISVDPEFGEAYNELGIVLMRLGNNAEANTAFSAAQEMLPNSAEVLNNNALSLEMTGNISAAIAFEESADKLLPNDPVIKNNLIRLRQKAGLK